MQSNITTTLAQAGIDADLIEIHRSGFQRVPTDDKPRSRNGAVVVLSVRPLRIWFQNHATGVVGLFDEGGGSSLPSKVELQRIMRARREVAAMREASQTEVAARAEALWQSAKRADPDHPYLVRKQIEPHSIRQIDDNLVVPLRLDCAIKSLQFISPAGEKKFMYGGRVAGCNFSLGIPRHTLLVAEGVATGCTLAEVLELGVSVAFNAGNLKSVAIDLARRYPQSRIIVCADNDVRTVGNPGLRYAHEAAAAVGGKYIAPQFSMRALVEPLSDWNDYRTRYGEGALRACFEEVRNVG